MNEPDTRTSEEREKLLRKIWLLRQLVSAVLLVALLALLFLARQYSYIRLAQFILLGLYVWPVYAVVIAWWDRHWVWKHQDRMLNVWKRL